MTPATSSRKKLIYIMGCGRSGTTILGFVLGNGKGCLDLGEVTDYLNRDGKPNGFGLETTNGKFWASVTQAMLAEDSDIFRDQRKVRLSAIEHHRKFIPLCFGLIDGKVIAEYKNYINSLYRKIFNESNEYTCFVDSSKFPGRCWLLANLMIGVDLGVIHLVRDPVSVVRSFGDKSKRQGYKNLVSANLYYFVINFFCVLVKAKIGGKKYLKVRYEDLLADPERVLDGISEKFNIDLENSKKNICHDRPLYRGFLFNGNRMRMKEKIVLKRERESLRPTFGNIITMLFNRIWY